MGTSPPPRRICVGLIVAVLRIDALFVDEELKLVAQKGRVGKLDLEVLPEPTEKGLAPNLSDWQNFRHGFCRAASTSRGKLSVTVATLAPTRFCGHP
jgi:hypothetical protein